MMSEWLNLSLEYENIDSSRTLSYFSSSIPILERMIPTTLIVRSPIYKIQKDFDLY